MRQSDQAVIPLPQSAIVGFMSLVGLDSIWKPGAVIVLAAIARAGTTFTFTFHAQGAAGLAGRALSFSRDLADAEFAAEAADVGRGPTPCDDDLLWQGTLVTGTLGDLAAVLPAGDSLKAAANPPVIEPCLVQDLSGTYLRSVSLANAPRTLAGPPAGCGQAPTASSDYIVAARCLRGTLLFQEGYNCAIRQNSRDNSLTFSGRQGAGAGAPCEEVPLSPAEVPPGGTILLSGGPACDQVITSINGLSAAMIRLEAGTGVTITEDPANPHTLVVDFNMSGLAYCPPAQGGGTAG